MLRDFLYFPLFGNVRLDHCCTFGYAASVDLASVPKALHPAMSENFSNLILSQFTPGLLLELHAPFREKHVHKSYLCVHRTSQVRTLRI